MSSKYGLYLVGLPPEERALGGIVGWTSLELENLIYLVKGPYKLLTLFMKVLLTRKGTVIGQPDTGTEIADLVGGNIGDSKELQDLLLIALQDAADQVTNLQQSADKYIDLDDNELLKSATLVNFEPNVDGTGFSADIEIENIAGYRVRSQLPFSTR